MKFSEEFGGKYFKAADFVEPVLLTIAGFTKDQMPDETLKCVAHFEDERRGLVLNATNANTISGLYGDEMSESKGKPLVLYPAKTEMNGKTVPCIRVREPNQPPPPQGDKVPF